mmetsp:Transcript_66983/g.190010  ORF Transcript_66983/g.190010 Transcript_66983/m.190010 type:complete len:203 (-) Transcript_66983:598-1206(-)
MTCSMMPKAFAPSRCTSGTGSESAAWSSETTPLRYGWMKAMSLTSNAVDPKICADHFLLMDSRSLSPLITMGSSRARDASSISDLNVWLPILARTPCVCFWFVGSASAATRSAESSLISALATMPPIVLRTAPVAVRISFRDSSAASASFVTMDGRCSASCVGVASICCRQGCRSSMHPTLTFHFLSTTPARTAGITRSPMP